ncbi:L,D-transpeptidase [Patescibacteria group bacterium]
MLPYFYMSLLKFSKNKVFLGFIVLSLVVGVTVVALTKQRVETYPNGCGVSDLSGEIDPTAKIAIFEGEQINIPYLAEGVAARLVLGENTFEKWIEIDLSEQKLRAWDGDNLLLETLVSTGLPWYPTPKGEFRVWAKLRATKMEGGSGKYYYYLPNVPYVMFFENSKVPGWRGYGLHGTYWHNDFGTVHSHGCVNLPTTIAETLYYWASPIMPDGKYFVRSSENNPGTRVVIHE